MNVEALTRQRLKEKPSQMRTGSACGVEGWRMSELKRLPLVFLIRLAAFYNVIEETGTWPTSLERALITFIPKDETGSLEAVRPITVMSTIYRLWAAARLRDCLLYTSPSPRD